MSESEKIGEILGTREIVYSNTKNCEYLRINSCCVHDENCESGRVNSCKKYICPIRIC